MPVEQGEALDAIIEKIGGKLGVDDKNQLLRKIAAEFIQKYEDQYGPIQTRESHRRPDGSHGRKPVDAT